jgi:phospholipid/cholesterol/gamma-HCH transport system permease protein
VAPDRWLKLEAKGAEATLHLAGDWRLSQLPAIAEACAALDLAAIGQLTLDGARLEGLDSSGAMLLVQRLQAENLEPQLANFESRHQSLFSLVAQRLAPEPAPTRGYRIWLHALGRGTTRVLRAAQHQLAFLGRTGEALGELLAHPTRLRPRELLVQLQVVGLEGMVIVALMTFLIGVVFAYLLGIQIEKYGANIFIVDGVAIAVCRELAPMLTAVLVAGRSGAAFTAQIGAMKVTEEIDAIATLGLSPYQVLVLPRLLAILVAMPLLTFFGDIMGLLGAAVVAAQQLDITFYTFFSRLQDVLPLDSVFFGLYKAPAFAAAIALIACRNGFAVSRDARSVGEGTTRTVVQSLVAVILINAAYALASPEYRGE